MQSLLWSLLNFLIYGTSQRWSCSPRSKTPHLFGKVGCLANANSSCGWSPIIGGGLQIVLLQGGYLMNVASYVIRRKKQLTTCLFHVFSLGKNLSVLFRTPRLTPSCCFLLSLSFCTVVQPVDCSPFPFLSPFLSVQFILFEFIYQQWGLPLLYLWIKKCGLLQQVSLQALTSQPNEISFDN